MVGCDTGGTFTDVFAVSETGESRVAKVPSTPPRFDIGVIEGVRALGIEPSEVTTLFHGTTVRRTR
jgi:N-methylhydantoinase A